MYSLKVIVSIILDSRVTELFIDPKFTIEQEFKLDKLKQVILVKNVDRTINIDVTT